MNTRAFRNIAVILGLAAVSLLSFFALRADAEDQSGTALPLGTWRGELNTQTRLVPATFIFKSTDRNGASLIFGEPWACSISLRYVRQEGNKSLFNIFDTTGGRCDRYIPGTIAISTIDGQDKLMLELTDEKNAYPLRTNLRLMQPASAKAKALPVKKLSKNKSN